MDPHKNAARSPCEREHQRTFIFLDSFQCQYVPAELLIYMEMLFDIDSLVTVTVQ